MGLDSFIFKISRPEHLDKKQYTVKEIEGLGLVCIPYQDLTQANKNNLRCCVAVLEVENLYYDLEKIRAEYGLSEDAHIGALMGDGSIDVVDSSEDNPFIRVSISHDEIKEKFILRQTDKCYVFRREIVKQWRSEHKISAFFNLEAGPTENISYYPVDEYLAAEFNDRFHESLPTKAMPKGTGLFYYEWF